MRIPTLPALALLIAVVVSVGLYFFYFREKTVYSTPIPISDLKVVNITNNSATVVWQTNEAIVGSVVYSQPDAPSQTAKDNRDRDTDTARQIHYVTINNLKPGSKYVYRVKNGTGISKDAWEFLTSNVSEESTDEVTYSFIKPLRGTILNTNLNPVDESIVLLNISGAQELATFSSTSGNFILSLKTVLTDKLDKFYLIADGTPAELTIIKGNIKSSVKIKITDELMNLPPIPLGSNLDLQNFESPSVKTITFSETDSERNLDFNDDKKINSLDLAILRGATSLKDAASIENTEKFDINLDGIVDAKDIDMFSKRLSGN